MWKTARFDLEEVRGLMERAKEYGHDLIYLIEESGTDVSLVAGEDAAERKLYADSKIFARESSVRSDGQGAEEPYPILVAALQHDVDQLRSGDPMLVKYSDIGVFIATRVKTGQKRPKDEVTPEELFGDEMQKFVPESESDPRTR